MNTAIITGITGQDGAYLSQLLLKKKYKVIGLVRSSNSDFYKNLNYLGVNNSIQFVECDLRDLSQVLAVISKYKPSEIYNLAAQSSVSLSFEQPIGTIEFNIISVLNLLESIRLSNKSIKFYQASSSEMYGKVAILPITEKSILHPLSPYAISKVAAHQITINYRETYGLYACCGILFNHESYLRANNFFIKKLLRGAIEILKNKQKFIEFGNLDIKRDFGYSPNYVEAMYLMMQQKNADDFLICTGRSLSLKSIVEHVFHKLHIDFSKIKTNKQFLRPNEIEDIYGSNIKATKSLNWKPEVDFFKIIDILLAEELKNYEKN